MRKKILILNDRSSSIKTLINLGDRAMLSGIYQMIEKGLGFDIISGGCKTFPYYNIHKYKHEKNRMNVQGIFQKWFNETVDRARRSVTWEERVSRFLDNTIFLRNRLFSWLDDRVKAHFTRGLLETVKPYLLKKYYSHLLIKRIEASDYVLFNGYAIVSDRFSTYLPTVLFECYLAKRLGKRVITANQTIDIEDPDNLEMVSFVYQMLDLHLSREPLTIDTLRKLGIEEDKLISSCDAAFAADFTSDETVNDVAREEHIDSGSVALVIRGDRPVDYDAWIRIINHLESQYNKKAVVLFTCITQDLHVYNKLAKHCNLRRLSRFYDFPVLERLLRKFDFLIADRYHAIIFSIRAETPVLPFSPAYRTNKIEGLFRLFRYPIKVLPPLSKDTYDEFLDRIDYIDRHRDQLKRILAKTHNDLREKCERDIERISLLKDRT